MMKPLPSRETLLELLSYDPNAGTLRWRARTPAFFNGNQAACKSWNTRYADKEAFCTDNGDGYLTGTLFDRKVGAHRIIWKLLHDTDPEMVDHINRNPSDNRAANLRAANPIINSRNRIYRHRADAGIYQRHDVKGFLVIRYAGGRSRYGGVHRTIEAARHARDAIDKQFNRLTQEEAAASLRRVAA